MSDLRQLIGRPWRAGAEGPDAFDCYGLVRHVMRQRGVELPELAFTGDTLRDVALGETAVNHLTWTRLSGPWPWCLVLMGRKGNFKPLWTHVGVWFEPDMKVLHAQRCSGVTASSLAALRLLGYAETAFYAPRQHPAHSQPV
jgi:hypothetical protein